MAIEKMPNGKATSKDNVMDAIFNKEEFMKVELKGAKYEEFAYNKHEPEEIKR